MKQISYGKKVIYIVRIVVKTKVCREMSLLFGTKCIKPNNAVLLHGKLSNVPFQPLALITEQRYYCLQLSLYLAADCSRATI